MATAAAATPEAQEARLAHAFARREAWAFDEAYRRYGALLYSVALTVVHNSEDAEDCVHDVLVRVWNKRTAFTVQRGSVRAFLVVCVRNEAISRQRASARRAHLADTLAQNADLTEEVDITDHVENARVRAALAALPQEQRSALYLAYFGGKTHVEIAQLRNEPLGTVKSRISLGLRKLHAALTPEQSI